METEIEQMNSQYEIIQAQYKMANVLNSDKLENKEKYLKQLLQDQIDRNKRYVVKFDTTRWSFLTRDDQFSTRNHESYYNITELFNFNFFKLSLKFKFFWAKFFNPNFRPSF